MNHRHSVAIAGCAATCAGGGDVWHMATAHILCAKGAALGKEVAELVCLIGADIRGETRYIKPDRIRRLYEYLRSIGMRCILVKFDIGTGDGETHIGYEDRLLAAMDSLTQAQYDIVFDAQHTYDEASILDWQTLWSQTECTAVVDRPAQDPCVLGDLPSRYPRVLAMLSLHRMTTIVASSIHTGLSQDEKSARFAMVRHGLSDARANEPLSFVAMAERKVAELRSLIAAACMASESRRRQGAFVVLILYRKGTVNFRQDTSYTIFEQIRTITLSEGFIPIRVAVGLTRDELEHTDLDLFDVRQTSDLVDKRHIAHFWSLIYEMEEVFGVMGGRTGSLDAAAFQGLNSFSWDEPLMEVLAGPNYPQLKRFYSPTYVRDQYWQQILFFQLYSIHSTGVLDPESFDESTDSYQSLREVPLRKWLAGEMVVPNIPATWQSISLIVEACRTRLENEAIGLRSYNIRRLQELLHHQLGLVSHESHAKL